MRGKAPPNAAMRELITDLFNWKDEDKKAALATVIKTWGSSPRPVGSHMAVSEDGHFVGSVSGGCVETAVVSESLEVMASGKAKRLNFGVSDETAWEVGLACGGQIEIFVQPIDWANMSPILDSLRKNEITWYRITLSEEGQISLLQPSDTLPGAPDYQTTEQGAIFTNVVYPPNQLLIIGGVNIAQPLVTLAKLLDFSTVVIDPRRSFLTDERFPDADQLLHSWPQDALSEIEITNSTAVVVLSHDDKIDLPALEISLSSTAFYIGALGSTKTQKRRKAQLIEMGVPPEALEKIHGPIGLDIGGNSPTEIALAIIAQIVSESHRIIE